MRNKSQMALEFLTTYGWAFLVILVVLGALSYFGILSPSKFLPERCTMSSEFECQETQIDSSQNLIRIRLKNNMNQVIAISSITINSESSTALSCSSAPSSTGTTYSSTYWSESGLVAFTAGQVNDGTGTIGFHTDSSPVGSYLQLDLGAGNSRAMNELSIWTTGAPSQSISAVWNIEYSNDGSLWTLVYSGFGPFYAPPTPQPFTSSWNNAGTHRFWRLYKTNGAAGGGYHTEVQFYDTNLQAWKPGQTADLAWSGCNNINAGLSKGEKGKILVTIRYYDVQSGPSYSKEITGEFIANAV